MQANSYGTTKAANKKGNVPNLALLVEIRSPNKINLKHMKAITFFIAQNNSKTEHEARS